MTEGGDSMHLLAVLITHVLPQVQRTQPGAEVRSHPKQTGQHCC